MKSIVLNNPKDSLNKIESFVEDICEGLNISNTFLGNMLIAISEVVSLIEAQNSGVKIGFINEKKSFTFVFKDLKSDIDFNFDIGTKEGLESSPIEDSIFMINALCDDLKFDGNKNQIRLSFLNAGVDEIVSRHRKDYLSKYLNQQIKVN
jgi:hypothetical protein